MLFLLTLAVIGLFAWVVRLQDRVATLEREGQWAEPTRPETAEPPVQRQVARIVYERTVVETPVLAEPEPVSEAEKPGVPDLLPESELEREPRESVASMFERFVGGRLLIWAGGIAMAVAGVFLVRYSIEIGLITPAVRMIAAGVFGLALIALALLAARFPLLAEDPRIAQSLGGAGIAVLYATIYGSTALYALIGDTFAFVLMAAVTVLALALALRHGPPIAIMGLAGGFLTPLLVGSESDSVGPLLVYLGLLDVALFALAMRRGWWWLALGAVAASFVWTVTIVALAPSGDAVAAGMFVALLGTVAAALMPGDATAWRRYGPAALALIQLSILTARADIGGQAWALYGLMAAAGAVLALRRSALIALPAVSLALAVVLLGSKATMDWSTILPLAAIGATLIHAAAATMGVRQERGRTLFALVGCAALAIPALELRAFRPELLLSWQWVILLAGLGLAALPFLGQLRASPARIMQIASAAAVIPLMVALHDAVPLWLLPAAWLALAIVATFAARRWDAEQTLPVALVIAAAAVIVWPVADAAFGGHLAALFTTEKGALGAALRGLSGPALLLGVLAWLHRGRRAEPVLVGIATLFAAMLLLTPLPATLRPLAMAAVFTALVELTRRGAQAARLSESALLATVAWMAASVMPLWETLARSVGGVPSLVTQLPAPGKALLVLALPLPLLWWAWRRSTAMTAPFRALTIGTAGAGAIAASYILAKQIVGIASHEDFVRYGFLERTILTQIMFAAALAIRVWRPNVARIGVLVLGLATARFVWFDLLALNPLLVTQAVGPLPLLNLVPVAYFGAAAWFWRERTGNTGQAKQLWLGLFLAALLMGATLIVRQVFTGSILIRPEPGNFEFYSYSAAALLLSIALLFAGTRLRDQPVRVAGLALLAATVVKVFAVDAAALDGILRILSFVGLGAALIGVGRLYTKLLKL